MSLVEATLTLHTVWSICVPIALVETFRREPRRPWLGNVGLTCIAVAFVADSLFLAIYQAADLDFVASPVQFAVVVAVIAAFVLIAFSVGRGDAPPSTGDAPSPWVVGALAFASTGVYWGESAFVPDLLPEWGSVLWWFVPVIVTAILCIRWSRRHGWDGRHRFALAAGALLTYVWGGFFEAQANEDVTSGVAVLGNVVFGAGAIVLLAVAAYVLHRRTAQSPPLG